LLPLLEHPEQQTDSFAAIHHSLRRDASVQAAGAVLDLLRERS
jgi:lipid-A-disaccharide synthase